MRELAVARCASQIAAEVVVVREGAAEGTGCPTGSVDAVLWSTTSCSGTDRLGFAELARVLRPGGRLVVTVHRHVLDIAVDHLARDAAAAGFVDVQVGQRPRKRNSPAVELLARRPQLQ